MRTVIVGISEMALETARLLVDREAEVILVDRDREWIEKVSDDLDCSFLHGDGSHPGVLEEADPERCDILFALTDSDQDNIIAGLVGRSLGFKRVVVSIGDVSFEPICLELGLKNVISPSRTISRYLADMARGIDILELHTMIQGEARFFAFEADEESAGAIADLELPEEARVICLYRDKEFLLTGDDDSIDQGDQVVILTHSKNLKALNDRFNGGGQGFKADD